MRTEVASYIWIGDGVTYQHSIVRILSLLRPGSIDGLGPAVIGIQCRHHAADRVVHHQTTDADNRIWLVLRRRRKNGSYFWAACPLLSKIVHPLTIHRGVAVVGSESPCAMP
jgi:hypothetical protein